MLSRASELWAYGDGKVHPQFCLTRSCLASFREDGKAAFENRSNGNTVQVRNVAFENKQKRAGFTISRTTLLGETEVGGGPTGVFEALLDLISVHPKLSDGPRSSRGSRHRVGQFSLGRKC